MLENLNLETFANGAFAEKFRNALAEVMMNIQDPNTSDEKARSLTMVVTLKPNAASERSFVNVTIDAKTKMQPVTSSKTSLTVGVNPSTGEIEVSEWDNQIKGQVKIPLQPEEMQQGENVIDLKKLGNQ